ncbi:MAG TPA: hypothetical protein VFN92_10715 [Solirubrobacterales bacterium]|nr:hypothetical protein [Solirubrobacterales bacterium]
MSRQLPGLVLALALLGAFASPASAEFGFAPSGNSVRMLDAQDQPEERAGAHPDEVQIDFAFNSEEGVAEGTVRDLVVELPPGLLGSPRATPTCPRQQYDEPAIFGGECTQESRIGSLEIDVAGIGPVTMRLHNVEPGPDEFATFGARLIAKIPLRVRLRPDDFGATLEVASLPQELSILGGRIDLWGVPADRQEETEIERRPLLVTPTRCDAPLAVTLRARSWGDPSAWDSVTDVASGGLRGCDELPFVPRTDVDLGNPVADSPTGAQIEVSIPQDETAEGRISSEVRALRLELPEGFSVSAPGANGLVACSDSQLARGDNAPARCPAASRIGSVELESPLLREPLDGGIFAGERTGDGFRLFVVAVGPGVEAKFVGAMNLDERTGRVTARLDRLPQIPFNRIGLEFDGGPYALLATPAACGAYVAEAELEGYAGGAAVRATAPATVSGGERGCGQPAFRPRFRAGSSSAAAGRFASFSTQIERDDGEAQLGQVTMGFPSGIAAVLRRVGRCSAAQAAIGACPPESRVGTSVVELGPGPRPIPLYGEAYFTGPFRGAPFGVAMVFRGSVGPFEIERVVVRGGIEVNSRTGGLTLATERLPRVGEGIPLRIRAFRIAIDRPGFIRNPSSCAPKLAVATMRSEAGLEATASSPFAVRGCGRLGFRPRVSIATLAAPAAAPKKPGLRIRVGGLGRGANLRSAGIRLPRLLGVDFGSLNELCSHRQALAGRCPRESAVGTATARTMLLAGPLKGSIFIAQPTGDGLPEFWIGLQGGGLGFDLRAKMAVADGRLETKLEDLPDLPLSSLSLRFAPGGAIASRRPLCGDGGASPRGSFSLLAQNYAFRAGSREIAEDRACGS